MQLMTINLTEKSIRTIIPRNSQFAIRNSQFAIRNSQLTHNDVKVRKRNALHCSFAPAEKLNQNNSLFSPCKTARDADDLVSLYQGLYYFKSISKGEVL